jgi:hypothetical protein
MGCTLCTIFAILFIFWAVWATIFIRRIYHTNMKDLMEPNVKFMSNYIVAQRYDCINIDLFKFTLGAIFLFPFRVWAMVTALLIKFAWGRLIAVIYGGKLS